MADDRALETAHIEVLSPQKRPEEVAGGRRIARRERCRRNLGGSRGIVNSLK